MSHNILYVEDDPMSRRVMKMLLVNRLGMNLEIWEDSTDFPEKIAALEAIHDLIFLDIHVLPYNGFKMLAILRENEQFKHLPIVALTASVMNEEVQELESAGFNGCLAKPIDVENFPNLLERLLGGEKIWHITH